MGYEYDKNKSVFSHCKFCHGRGRLACPGEAEKHKHIIVAQQKQPSSLNEALAALCQLEPMRSIIEAHNREREALPDWKKGMMRFDGKIYRDCPICDGHGCEQCPGEAEKEYKRQFPDGPKPIFTIDRNDVAGSMLKQLYGTQCLPNSIEVPK